MTFQEKLLDWYQENHRKLPFRESHNPYNIWVSEIMLQQTQMDTVLPYYERFTAAFPTVFDLAEAEEEKVMKLWEGLGYYSRARNLLKCARVLVKEHGGHFPEDCGTLLELPGIGPYTAGAILSIAYNQPVPAVDGNVMRVFSRLFNLRQDIGVPKNRRIFESKVIETLPENVRDYNQALMELGALICLPKNPKCDGCPLREDCVARSLSIQSQLPVKRSKVKNEKVHVAVGIIHNEDTILLTQSDTALLKGLWGFPIAEGKNKSDAKEVLLTSLSRAVCLEEKRIAEIGEAKHVFTHKTWLMTLYEFHVAAALKEENSGSFYDPSSEKTKNVWVTPEELETYAMATAFKKLLKFLTGPRQNRLPFSSI